MNEKKPFRDRVEAVLNECGNWFKDNASNLADVIEDGCQSWSIEFSWDTMTDEPSIPTIDIRVSKLNRNIINAALDFE